MAEDKERDIGLTVDNTQTVVAEYLQPKQRKEIFLCNISTGGQVIYLSIGSEAAVGKGIVLYPGGVFASSTDGNNFFPSNKKISAISNLAGGLLSGFERVGDFK